MTNLQSKNSFKILNQPMLSVINRSQLMQFFYYIHISWSKGFITRNVIFPELISLLAPTEIIR